VRNKIDLGIWGNTERDLMRALVYVSHTLVLIIDRQEKELFLDLVFIRENKLRFESKSMI
jgi:hypothetical protein